VKETLSRPFIAGLQEGQAEPAGYSGCSA